MNETLGIYSFEREDGPLARTKREKDENGIYYIQQRSSHSECLFCDGKDREHFLNILLESKDQNNWRLYGCCIASANEYRLILDANGSDISSIMKGINISFAKYAKRAGPLFRDRYRSQLIQNQEQLSDLLCRIQESGEEEGCLLLDENQAFSVTETDCQTCMRTLSEVRSKLHQIALDRDLPLEALLENKAMRNQLIREFRKRSTLSLKDLGEVFGGLTVSSICKIIRSREEAIPENRDQT